jgi:3-oxoacyl-[acyl-carrier protein] reductase
MTAAQVVLITGASRGVGAEVAARLGDPGRQIVVNYREKARRANDVVEAIRSHGGGASAVQADLTDERAVAAMMEDIKSRFGSIDVLVLNASGGMERGVDPGYAMRINCDAQLSLARAALPLMAPGARIVFVTSHQAHFYDRAPVPVDYLGVAVSKRAGEDALRAMRPVLEAHGVALVVVSGDMLEGSITVRLLERSDPAAVAARRAGGPLPTISEFAAAIVRATLDSEVGGQTVFVGGEDFLR